MLMGGGSRRGFEQKAYKKESTPNPGKPSEKSEPRADFGANPDDWEVLLHLNKHELLANCFSQAIGRA